MSGPGRLTVCAATASLLAALSLLPLATPMGWFGQVVLMVLVQAGAGAAARRVPLARPLTVTVQAVVALLLLTLVCAHREAVSGFLPGPDALGQLARLLPQGAQDVSQYATPAPVTPGIRLLLVGGVLLVALVVDVLAVTYRNAAPAGLALLALYSVATGLGSGGVHWLWFLCAAAGYLVLLLAEGRDRLSRWGRVFGGAPPRCGYGTGTRETTGQTVAAVRSGRRISAVAVGIALVAPAVLPSMDSGLLPVPGGAGLARGGGTISAVNPLATLQDSLNQTDDRPVLRYRTTSTDAADMYLRIVTLDDFDGTTWRAAERRVTNVPDTLPTPTGLGPGVRTARVDTSFSASADYGQTYLPMPYPASQVRVDGNWRYEPVGRTLVGDHGQTTAGLQYQVESLQVEPTARQLEDAPPPPAAIEQEYTQVPASLPAEVKQTAERVTRGSANAYQEAVRLQDWFTTSGGFTYDTQVSVGTGPDAIVRFLHEKRGFCVHFAFSMAAMARTLGIPARVDIGFVPGTLQSDNSWTVGLKDAHAWPELYFQGVGWTRFEPTPSRGTQPDYTRGPAASGGGSDLPAPRLSATPAPSNGPTGSPECGEASRRLNGCSPGSGVALGGPSGGGGPGAGAVAGLAVLALLLVLAALPAVWRARVRTVRLGGGRLAARRTGDRPGPGAPGAPPSAADEGLAAGRHVLAVWHELLDTAWDYGVAPDRSETPRRACDRLIRSTGLAGGPADAARRVARAVEQVLYAPLPAAAPGAADDVRLVRRALDGRAGRLVRLRARVAPRSAIRIAWQLRQRWSAGRSRWHRATDRVTAAVLAAVRPGS